ncbi:hypothetical protein BOTBODRAFT_120277 [Botryobasidium botryosum FD-172 SS1]|uniref:Winged helix-turn helix domain-containing protein n=1 Tax=Botryobasidium botryosum (strain FD-172 SS1) TaxID=930990 RepID=A0A067M6R4_BOTB1|nr:hypothetical protein BOTBODRAFT_120277 [Botryobasidium botryosum FD-172 SS1]
MVPYFKLELQYLHGALERSPDLYIEELARGIYESCGTSVSETTVWRALKKAGFTMKRVGESRILSSLLHVLTS